MNINRRTILLWTLAFVAVDVTLTVVSYRMGTLQHGRSPVLDLWDLAKALAIGGFLLATARTVASRGLAVIGVAAILIGLLGGTHIHGLLAGWLLPGTPTGVGKFAVLLTAVVIVITILFTVRDSWPHYPTVRRVTVLLVIALLMSAGILDLIGNFTGSSLVEESAERLVMSIALGCAVALKKSQPLRVVTR